MGELAVSRAFGDAEFKKGINEILGDDAPIAGGGGRADNNPDTDLSKPLIIAEPEVQAITLTPADDFMLLACDGLFDVLTNQEVRARRAREIVRVPSAQCPVPSAQCPVPSARCPVPGARCPVPGARCPVHSARCPVPGARCPVPGARCPVPSAHCSCSYPCARSSVAVKVALDRQLPTPPPHLQACDLILAEMARHGDVQRAAEALSRNAIDDCGSRDNVSILIVLLRQPW